MRTLKAMKLFKNGADLSRELNEFIKNSKNLYIYVPYIKLAQLRSLIDNQQNVQAVVVRWEPRDLIGAASDLEIYPYLRERGITLYRNSRLHLKAFVEQGQKAFIGSANISQRALNLPPFENYNYELATIVEDLTLDDRLYFNIIEAESILITDQIYEQIKTQLPEKIRAFPKESDFTLDIHFPDKDFSIASLPMTYNVETLYRIYKTQEGLHEVELACVLHDLATYRIPLGLPLPELKDRLQRCFLSHPFIDAFLKHLETEGQMYFGEVKEWIHAHCSDVPTPRRWEIKENIQILYRWIIAMCAGRYAVDRPNHSERLYFLK